MKRELENLRNQRNLTAHNLKVAKERLYQSSEQVVPEMPGTSFSKK